MTAKTIIATSFCLCMFSITNLRAQLLPAEMHFSDDGRRLITGGNVATGLYDEDSIKTIEFSFPQANYWTLLSNNYNSTTDLMASLTYDGHVFDSVGIRFKGQTSYRRNNSDKKSFNITMDYLIDGQNLRGYETLNLNCGYEDPSSMREILYNHLGRFYTPALKTNYVELKINGQNWGPYINVQQINGDYLKEWFLSNDGTRWRAVSPSGGGGGGPGGGGPGGNPFGTGVSSLNYNGPDVSDYNQNYTLKKTSKTNPWEDLIRVCDKLNNLPLNQLLDSLKYHLDIDKTLWFLAHEIAFVDDDSYINKGGMDYYVYWEPESNRIFPLEYDGNSCMNANRVSWSPFYNETDTRFPLMNRLFAVPELRQRYLAHLRTIAETYMQPDSVHTTINKYAAMIDPLVQADPKKIYSYTQFTQATSALKNFIVNRRNFLLDHAEVNVDGLNIFQVLHESRGIPLARPTGGQTVQVSAGLAPMNNVQKAWLYYGTGLVGVFERVEMFDDGTHNDGTAGDGIFGAEIPGFEAGTFVRYYIEAIANDAAATASYEPQGAEHDVYIYQIESASVEIPVVINELMASNDAAIADDAGEYDDWIELYNNGNQAIDLSGYFLTDNAEIPTKWQFPNGTSIDQDDYLIIWADNDTAQNGLHASFKLSAGGEELRLYNADTLLVDQITFGVQNTDVSFARVPNGTGSFVSQAATFSANNETATAIDDEFEVEDILHIYPNPATELVHIRINEAWPKGEVFVMNAMGQLVYRMSATIELDLKIDSWPSGLYFIQYKRETKRLMVY